MENLNSFLRSIETKSLMTISKGENTLAPSSFLLPLEDSLKENSIFRKYAQVFTIGTNTAQIPLDSKEYEVGWNFENENYLDKYENTWKKKQVNTYTLYCKIPVSAEFLEDMHFDVESYLIRQVSAKFLEKETQTFLYGEGKKEPIGLLKECKNIFETKEMAADLLEIYSKMPYSSLKGSLWFVSQSFYGKLLTFKKKESDLLSISDGQMYLLGIKVICMPIKEEAVLTNLSESFCIVDRKDITVIKDPFIAKPNVEFFFSKRLGTEILDANKTFVLKAKI